MRNELRKSSAVRCGAMRCGAMWRNRSPKRFLAMSVTSSHLLPSGSCLYMESWVSSLAEVSVPFTNLHTCSSHHIYIYRERANTTPNKERQKQTTVEWVSVSVSASICISRDLECVSPFLFSLGFNPSFGSHFPSFPGIQSIHLPHQFAFFLPHDEVRLCLCQTFDNVTLICGLVLWIGHTLQCREALGVRQLRQPVLDCHGLQG